MRNVHVPSRSARWVVLALGVFFGGMGLMDAPVIAADSLRETTSLKFVPADAGIYAAWLRNRQQVDCVRQSDAFARLREIPVVQMGLFVLQAQWQSGGNETVTAIRDWVERPENRTLLEVVADALSHEVFFCGSDDYASQFGTLLRIRRAMNLAQLEGLATGQDPDKVVGRRLLAALVESADELQVPVTTMGFGVRDSQRAEGQLERLEELLAAVLGERPELKDRLRCETFQDTEFLTLRLDGSLIPWDEIPTDELGVDAEAVKELVAKVKQITLTISLGIRDNYLLLSVGPTNEHLAAPAAADLLVDRKELAALCQHADKPITSMAYVSERLMREIGAADRQIDDLVMTAEKLIPLAGLAEDAREELIADAKALGNDIKKYLPVPGAMMGFAYLTPRGYEGYTYNWAENVPLDGSGPLSILEHVGGKPLLFYAARGKSSPEDYDLLVQWARRVAHHVDRIAASKLSGREREIYDRLRPQLVSLGQRLDGVIRERFLPALNDRQAALVVDAQSTSRQWHAAMPASQVPLPMLELATVKSLSDAEAYRRGCAESLALVQEVLDLAHAAAPDDVPKIELPKPVAREIAAGKIYAYAVPAPWGVDAQIAPNLGLSDDVAVMSYVPAQTERLLARTPFEGPGPLAGTDRPLAAAGYCDWAALVDVAGHWIDYATDLWAGTGEFDEDSSAEAASARSVKEQIAVGLSILKCLRDLSSVTYFEDDAQVTHYEWHFEDL